MRSTSIALVTVLLVLAFSGSASADETLRWHVGGGYTGAAGFVDTYVDKGWGLNFGGFWRPNDGDAPLGIRFDVAWDNWDVNVGRIVDGAEIDDGDASSFSITGGGQWESRRDGKVNFLAGAGVGVYFLEAELTEEILIPGWICDPWWGWCTPGLVPGDIIVADRSETEFGWYANIGLTIELNTGQLAIESRYHWVDVSSETFEFFPITVAYRW